MQINREIPAPIEEGVATSAQVFWGNVTTTCQLTAVQILDDMVAVNFQSDQQDGIPVPILTWYFWQRASILVQVENQMSDGVRQRDLQQATTIAGDLHKQLQWLSACQREDAPEQNACRALHQQVTEALAARPYLPLVSDQTYGGNVPSPRRIQLVV